MKATSMWHGITVEILPISDCPHCGRVPHHVSPEGALDCAACLQRPTRYSLPRGASDD